MKSRNEASGEKAPLIAPPRSRNAGHGAFRFRWRALGASVATCMAIFGLEALAELGISTWRGKQTVISDRGRPFEWSQVCFEIPYSSKGW
jgi:hypothetical protein